MSPGAARLARLRGALLGDGGDGSMARFLAGRGAASHLVSSRTLLDSLPADDARGFTWSPTLEGVAPGARTIFLDDDTDEAGLLVQARALLPGRRLLGLRHHVAPMLASDRRQPLKDVPDDFDPRSLRRHVIVCPARSGSTYLAQMLGQAGAGRAREHLRDALLAAWRSPGVDQDELWRQMAWRAARDGIFASKLIGDFLIAAADGTTLERTLDRLAPDGIPVVALHRPVIDTVVSRFVAGRTRVFHVRGALAPEERQRFESPAYDGAELRRVLAANLRENRAIEELLQSLPAARVLHVDYADIDARPLEVVERVCGFLGATARLDALKPDRLPIKLSSAVDTHARLRERLLRDLQAEGVDIAALQR